MCLPVTTLTFHHILLNKVRVGQINHLAFLVKIDIYIKSVQQAYKFYLNIKETEEIPRFLNKICASLNILQQIRVTATK